MRKNLIIMASVALMASTGGYFLAMILSPPPRAVPLRPVVTTSEHSTEDMVGRRRPEFTLKDTGGRPVSASDFDGRVWLLNFWATWCAPCVEEMPMLSRLQQSYRQKGVSIVGIALDDEEKAREFARELSINYPILVGLTEVMLVGREYGNRAGMLPYSVLIDQKGTVRWTHLGALESEELENQMQALF